MVWYMKQTIQIMNIKCCGCANTITKALEKVGAEDVHIDIKTGTLQYTKGPKKEDITSLLSSLGYPEVGSPEAENFIKKAKSYVSCALGKL
ncbi:MAG: hypothetical protein HHAS10_02530 [Candidatus Altimarinota bacterium]